MTDNYTKREHDIIFNDIKESLKRIEDQVTKTNGRVNALELWREGTIGKFTIISVIVGMVVSTGVAIFLKSFK